MPRLCELYPGIRLTTEEKARKNLSQGSRTIRIHKPCALFISILVIYDEGDQNMFVNYWAYFCFVEYVSYGRADWQLVTIGNDPVSE